MEKTEIEMGRSTNVDNRLCERNGIWLLVQKRAIEWVTAIGKKGTKMRGYLKNLIKILAIIILALSLNGDSPQQKPKPPDKVLHPATPKTVVNPKTAHRAST